jgi:hypothetical protein
VVRGMVAELSPRKCLRNGLWVKLINITNRLSSFVCACYLYTAMCFLVIFLFSVKQASISHVFRFKYLVDTHTYTTAIDMIYLLSSWFVLIAVVSEGASMLLFNNEPPPKINAPTVNA